MDPTGLCTYSSIPSPILSQFLKLSHCGLWSPSSESSAESFPPLLCILPYFAFTFVSPKDIIFASNFLKVALAIFSNRVMLLDLEVE
jgi:hypothetical protein